jgi:hypothetical protein
LGGCAGVFDSDRGRVIFGAFSLAMIKLYEMEQESFIHLEQGQSPDSPLRLLWMGKARTYVSSSVCADELVIIADFGGNITALERQSGKRVWTANSEDGIAENLFLFDGLVWGMDVKGNIGGYDLRQGQCQVQYKLERGGWGGQRYQDHICFVNRASRYLYGRNGVASKMDLRNGEISVFADGVLSDRNGYKNNTRIIPEEGAVVFFIAPDLVKFSISDGTVIHKWHIPHCISLSGLLLFGDCWVAVTELDTGWKTSLGGKRYLEYNSTPVVFSIGDQLEGFPVLARGVFTYANRAAELENGRFLIEAAEWLFLYEEGRVQSLGPLPGRHFWGNRGAGLFAVDGVLVVFQVDYSEKRYFLNTYVIDPMSLETATLGSPMLTHPLGRNFLGAAVDQYGNDFLLRGDGRFYFLSWNS